MASLEESLRLKAKSVKAPALSGQAPLKTPDSPLREGDSGGISASKAKKNAGSTRVGNPSSPANNGFLSRLGVPEKYQNKNSTNEYM